MNNIIKPGKLIKYTGKKGAWYYYKDNEFYELGFKLLSENTKGIVIKYDPDGSMGERIFWVVLMLDKHVSGGTLFSIWERFLCVL